MTMKKKKSTSRILVVTVRNFNDVTTERKGICHEWVNDRTELGRGPCFKGCQLLYTYDLFGFMCTFPVKSVKPY